MKNYGLFAVLALVLVCACTTPDTENEPLVLKPASFSDLSGWSRDDPLYAVKAFAKSCERILKKSPQEAFGPDGVGGTFSDWQAPCQALPEIKTTEDARRFFEIWFTPWEARAGAKETEGLFTGYYEASLKGALKPYGPYRYPLHLRPDDLVMVHLGDFREELKGQRIAGRVKGGTLKPYENRTDIVNGKMPDDLALAFVWVDNPVDAFFLHIQGSGRVLLESGDELRVGYAGQNGHPYYAIGRELIKRGELEKEDVSMQSIRQWLEDHPDQAAEVMNTNNSYVFFQILEGEGPLGGEGVALTPGRSLAVDRTRIPYGVPVWLETESLGENEGAVRRLMVAQDTGGAIRGPVRGDVYWGFGKRAEDLAGKMKARGRYWLLLPRSVYAHTDS